MKIGQYKYTPGGSTLLLYSRNRTVGWVWEDDKPRPPPVFAYNKDLKTHTGVICANLCIARQKRAHYDFQLR